MKKNLIHTLLIVLLTAMSSTSLVAMKRKAGDELPYEPKRQKVEVISNQSESDSISDDDVAFKRAHEAFQDEKAMDELTMLMATTNPTIQESIQAQVTNIFQGMGGHLELQKT